MTATVALCPICSCPRQHMTDEGLVDTHRRLMTGETLCTICKRLGCHKVDARGGLAGAQPEERLTKETGEEEQARIFGACEVERFITVDATGLSLDACAVVKHVAERAVARLRIGNERYGPLVLAGNSHVWRDELRAEIDDAGIYSAICDMAEPPGGES